MKECATHLLLSLPPCSFEGDDYTVKVRINDYLDIICPHYAHGEVPSHAAERYVLYMVEEEDYKVCKPHSFDQLRWECSRPFAPHAPEKFSEKFQRFTPFTLGKEFRQGESYYYICKYLFFKSFFLAFFFRIRIKYVRFFGPFCSQANASPRPGLPEAEGGGRGKRLWKDAGQAQSGKKRKRSRRRKRKRKRKVRCQWGSSQPVQPAVGR